MSVFESSIRSFAANRLCVVRDDIGDGRYVLVAPAHEITPQEVNRILLSTGGLTFVALSPERAAAFMLSPMARSSANTPHNIASAQIGQYTSVEAREGVSTGISAADRATTIRALGDTHPHPRSLVKPGHIFPVVTKSGGSLVKAEIPEAALDIVILGGFSDAALFVDLLDRSGAFLSDAAAAAWAQSNDIPILTISQIIQHRLAREPLVVRLSEADLPTREAGTVRVIAYRSRIHDAEHVALVKGQLELDKPVLVRVQVENAVADIFGGQAPGTRQQILGSLRALNERGGGVLLYLRRDSLAELPIFTHAAPSQTPPTQPATAAMREYGVGAQILRDLGISQIELLSSTQKNLIGLDSFGISVVAQRPIPSHDAVAQEHPHG